MKKKYAPSSTTIGIVFCALLIFSSVIYFSGFSTGVKTIVSSIVMMIIVWYAIVFLQWAVNSYDDWRNNLED